MWRLLGLVCLLGSGLPVSADDYAETIRPLLNARCVRCHGPKTQQASLRLDTAAGVKAGGDSGAGFLAGKSGESLLIHAVLGTGGASKMPPEGAALTANEIEALRRWIDAGAPAPANEVAVPAEKKPRDHWAFQPIRKPAIPPSSAAHPIDAFIHTRLQQEGLSPSPPAQPATLLRRVHLDLLGLPVAADVRHLFLADDRPDAYERLVDRLLASPHYGERWGRDWLDAARYADSNGFTRDMPRTIWPYRDWVVNAFNANLPFDQFTIEQLAGDLLPTPSLAQRVATGFHRNTLINEEGGTDPEQFRVESVVDRVNTTGAVFLGLTLGCAQCHDHKYDPLAQREYYQFLAFFNSSAFAPGDQAAPRIDVPSDEQLRRGEPERKQRILAQISVLQEQLKDRESDLKAAELAWEKTLTEDDKKALPFNVKNALDLPERDRSAVHKRDLTAHFRIQPVARAQFVELDAIGKLQAEEPQFPTTMVMEEAPAPRETFVMLRGDFLRPGAPVQANVPAIFPPLPARQERPTRLDLARWLVSPENPLTARVFVNRVWQRYFGRGLVATENDFGTQGEPPSHPELLDWLAAEFIDSGWDVKRLHRLIVTSATYRQSAHFRTDVEEHDPLNRWLARQNRLRLDAELIRDSALAISGLHADELGGPPVTPPQPDGVFDFTQDKKPWKSATGASRYRRGLYTYLWRSSLYPALTVFDFPDPNVACTRRNRSNTPLQALTLANDQTFLEFARGLGERLQRLPGDDAAKITSGFEWCVARTPDSAETARLGVFLSQQRTTYASDPGAARLLTDLHDVDERQLTELAAWTAVARALLNLDEFITRE